MPSEPLSVVAVAGRTISVRPVRAADSAGLYQLYDELDPDDRYRRFFCGYHPPVEFFERLAMPRPREARIVAELRDGAGTTLVGEAGYALIDNGNGELGMAVAKPWRGFLGTHLLDLLCAEAARCGVPNLEAEVLAINTPMIRLMRMRAAVVVGHDGWSSWRLMIGTDGEPSWAPTDDRPRVLVESAGSHWELDGSPITAGMQVVTCNGPRAGRSCPELLQRNCPLAASADVIVAVSHQSGDVFDAIAEAHRRLHPHLPVVVDRPGEPGTASNVGAAITGLSTPDPGVERSQNGPNGPTAGGAR